jgi:hypothetical protein
MTCDSAIDDLVGMSRPCAGDWRNGWAIFVARFDRRLRPRQWLDVRESLQGFQLHRSDGTLVFEIAAITVATPEGVFRIS